jgi:trimethylamine:corrinoid methyltransferase-like protein
MDRRPYNVWEEKRDDGRDWALAKAREILATHQPEPLDPKISGELSRIITSMEGA